MQRDEFEIRALEHMESVYRMALQLTRHADEASDLVQETYLKALRASGSFEEQGGGIRPWLFKILHNAFYTKIAKARRGPIAVEAFHGEESSEQRPDEPRPAYDLGSLDWDHVDGRLKAAIDALSPEYREVLLLWGVEGMKYREIALIMEVPIGTIMSRLHRARAILAQQLSSLAGEVGFRPDGEQTLADGGTGSGDPE